MLDVYLVATPRPPQGTRPKITLLDLERARSDIKKLDPLIVSPNPRSSTSPYLAIGNLRTYYIAVQLGLDKVPIVVRHSGRRRTDPISGDTKKGVSTYPENPILLAKLIQATVQRELKSSSSRDGRKRYHSFSHIAREENLPRSKISVLVRLLTLPPAVQDLIERRKLPFGKADALLRLMTHRLRSGASKPDTHKEITQLAKRFVSDKWSTRECETYVAKKTAKRKWKSEDSKSLRQQHLGDYKRIEESLGEILGAKVVVGEKQLMINFDGNLELLSGICERIGYRDEGSFPDEK
jgi:ParB-like chromosome segregation protein Spo0J